MNCYNMVLEYINKNEKGIPIFIEEIKEYIIKFYNEKDKEKVFNNVKAILNRMNKEGIIETAYKGIYYIPNENIFGKMLLGNRKIIQYKYIMDKDGNIKGYVTGAKLFNEAHLTTQVPNIIDIATNECKNFNKYENKNKNCINCINNDFGNNVYITCTPFTKSEIKMIDYYGYGEDSSRLSGIHWTVESLSDSVSLPSAGVNI